LADAEKYQAVSKSINKSPKRFPERVAKRKHALDALCLGILVNLTVSLTTGGFGGWY
jgi:hypothetical protein